ncbi:MAG: altronate dehydratase [Anaerolineae bacterium]|nr:altronate dehydratase [Anaerolineae bacterium]
METQDHPQHDVIVLHAADDVAIALSDLPGGWTLRVASDKSPRPFETRQPIPSGHKVALCAIEPDQAVRRYGQVIGFASQRIEPGDHVHSHNLVAHGYDREYAFGVDAQLPDLAPEAERRTFQGYLRADGRVGTRNYVALISTVNCSAHVTREIAHAFTPERLAPYPNVDGVIALTHHTGCSFQHGGPDYVLIQRTLAGMATHPNVGAYAIVGLGCEENQIDALVANYALDQAPGAPQRGPVGLVIQELGGVRKTIEAGIAAVERLLPVANATTRSAQPVSELLVALQCGGSDGWSGVTANPLAGHVTDALVRQGGSVLLGETPEIYGTEQMLIRRAISREVGEKLLAQIRWWEAHARRSGAVLDNNPSQGNKAGGLTTIYEKSLGAIAKSGHTPLTGVYEYAERVTTRGVGWMNSPGNDWIAVTGQVASGCTLVLFTTGRGSAFGFKPSPVIKVCSNSRTYARMTEDMDVNAGRLLEGTSMGQLADELFDLVIAVASGEPSKSEAQGIGEAEFCPWGLGGIL